MTAAVAEETGTSTIIPLAEVIKSWESKYKARIKGQKKFSKSRVVRDSKLLDYIIEKTDNSMGFKRSLYNPASIEHFHYDPEKGFYLKETRENISKKAKSYSPETQPRKRQVEWARRVKILDPDYKGRINAQFSRSVATLKDEYRLNGPLQRVVDHDRLVKIYNKNLLENPRMSVEESFMAARKELEASKIPLHEPQVSEAAPTPQYRDIAFVKETVIEPPIAQIIPPKKPYETPETAPSFSVGPIDVTIIPEYDTMRPSQSIHTYTTKEGDTLERIGEQLLGKVQGWVGLKNHYLSMRKEGKTNKDFVDLSMYGIGARQRRLSEPLPKGKIVYLPPGLHPDSMHAGAP